MRAVPPLLLILLPRRETAEAKSDEILENFHLRYLLSS
jgi:hypothetical protein